MSDLPASVSNAFDAFPSAERDTLARVRNLILEVAAACGAAPLTETLKWGQPAYLTEATKSGTTIRLGLDGGRAALFVHCQTTLVEGYRADFPGQFEYDGNRAVRLTADFDADALAQVIARALTYHRQKSA